MVRTLIGSRRRGRGRDEDEGRVHREVLGIESSCYRDRPRSVQKTELPSSTASISTDRPMKVDWVQDQTASNWESLAPTRQRKNPIRLFDCALINVVHGRERTQPPPIEDRALDRFPLLRTHAYSNSKVKDTPIQMI